MLKELKRITDIDVQPPPEELEQSFLVGELFTVSKTIFLSDEGLPSVCPGVYMLLGGEPGRTWHKLLGGEDIQTKGRMEDKVYFDHSLTFPSPGVKKVLGMYRCTFRHYIKLEVITKGVKKYAQMVGKAMCFRKDARLELIIVDYL